MPELQRLSIGDDPPSWEAAGFSVTGGETLIGNISVGFVEQTETDGRDRNAVGWELTGLTGVGDEADTGCSIDGIETVAPQRQDWAAAAGFQTRTPVAQPFTHRNRVSRLDHVVIMTPDIERTISSLHDVGFSTRRTRDIPAAEPPRRQVFLWAGDTILEVVGPVTANGSGPATIWGLALTTDDMDAAVAELGTAISEPRDAIQPGRKIATIKTKDLGISIALALMTPHVPVGQADTPTHQPGTPGSSDA